MLLLLCESDYFNIDSLAKEIEDAYVKIMDI